MTRFLRPAFLVPVRDRLWVVDEFQPVAAVLDAAGTAVERLVSYPALPVPPVTTAPWWDGWRVLGSDAGMWVQPRPGGPVGLVGESGLAHATYSGETRLAAATAAGAWCMQPHTDRAGGSTDPSTPLSSTRVLLVRPDGRPVEVDVGGWAHELRAGPDGVYVRVGGQVRASDADEHTWVRLPPDGADPEPRPPGAVPPHPPKRSGGFPGPGSPWHSAPNPDRPGPLVDGLRWEVGLDAGQIPRPRGIATAHDPDSLAQLHRFDLGTGEPISVAAYHRFLYVARWCRRRCALAERIPAELSRVDVRRGAVEPVLAPDSVDITDLCWPRLPRPVDVESYVDYQRRYFGNPDAVWTSPRDGTVRPLADGIRDSRVVGVGDWPDTALDVSFAHDDYPGLRLRRRLPLFDELGRPVPPQHAAVHVMETVDCRNLPPATEAVDGILDF